MSRVGKQTIEIPNDVTVSVVDGIINVKGPKGQLKRPLNSKVKLIIEENTVRLEVAMTENKQERSLWGTFASHVINMIQGVSAGFEKKLEINGVGYRASMQGKDIKLEVGYSHQVLFELPEGITGSVDKNVITISGIDKELVGDIAARLRAVRKPEPYKGKGIKYIDEIVRRKAGKTAAKSE